MEKKEGIFARSNFISYLYLPLTLLFYELLVLILAGFVFNLGNFVAMIFICLATGTILNLLVSLSKNEKWNAWLAFLIIEVIAIIVMIAYFVQDTYQNFTNIATVFGGAEGIVKEFGAALINIIKNNVPKILLFEAPAIIFLFLGPIFHVLKYQKNKPKAYVSMLIAFLIFEAVGIGLSVRNQDNRDKVTAEYDFNTVVRCFNLETGLKMDLLYLTFPNPYESVFLAEDDTEYASGSKDFDAAYNTDKIRSINDNSSSGESKDTAAHEMGIDYSALAASADNKAERNVHDYIASLEPSDTNQYTGLFKGKNLIFISAEAMSLEMITEDTMPTLYHMQQEGIVFKDYYQPYWNGSTSTGEFSNLLGIIPTKAMYSYEHTLDKNLYLTIGNVLMREDYFSRAYHNGTVDYYDRNLINPNFGYEKFIANGNGMEEGLSGNWPESDLEMMQYAVPQFLNEEPFSIYFMTLSGHFPYFHDLSIMVEKYEDRIKEKGYSDVMSAYICSEIDLEEAVKYLLEELKKAGLYEDTVIVMAPDHYPYGLTKNDAWGTDQNYLPELYGFEPKNLIERDHNSLIIWSPMLEKLDPIVVTEPSYSVDILPTLLNLYGADYDSRLLAGRDVLSETEGLVIWPDYSWKTAKGSYLALTNSFEPSEALLEESQSSEDPEAYLNSYKENMKAIVRNKMTFSSNVIDLDYYNILFGN